MKKTIMMALLVLTFVKIDAQYGKGYYIMPQAVLLNGDHAASGQVQLVGGIAKKKWEIGMGAAIDYYKVRTVPLFLDLRNYYGVKKSTFSYLQMGTNIAWALESQYSYNWIGWNNSKSSFSNGAYGALGIGYACRGKNSNGMIMGLGYSVKTIRETRYETIYKDFPPYGTETSARNFLYIFNRFDLHIGYRL